MKKLKNCLSRSRVRKGHWTWFLGFLNCFHTGYNDIFIYKWMYFLWWIDCSQQWILTVSSTSPTNRNIVNNITFGLMGWFLWNKAFPRNSLLPLRAATESLRIRRKTGKLRFQPQDIISSPGRASVLLLTGNRAPSPLRGSAARVLFRGRKKDILLSIFNALLLSVVTVSEAQPAHSALLPRREFCALLLVKNISFIPPKKLVNQVDNPKLWKGETMSNKLVITPIPCLPAPTKTVLITAVFTSLFPSCNAYVQCSSINA